MVTSKNFMKFSNNFRSLQNPGEGFEQGISHEFLKNLSYFQINKLNNGQAFFRCC